MMNTENPVTATSDQLEMASDTASVIDKTMEKFLDAANVDHVYGEAVKYGDTVVIPAAEVVSVAAFGIGIGSGNTEGAEQGEVDGGTAGAGGGGGRVFSRPVAVIVASPEGIRVEPVIDPTKVLLAALTTFGFMFSMLSRIRKSGRSLDLD